MTAPVVAIVGRPNVGKSTLFNRLTGRRQAIVEAAPGTTRDRIYGDVSWEDKAFIVVDTGGLESGTTEGLVSQIRHQVELAIVEADIILFVVDGAVGLVAGDEEIAQRLRRSQKSVLLVANKTDHARHEAGVAEFYRLGLGEPYMISAYHGRGVTELLDKLSELLPPFVSTKREPGVMMLAIVGRPNVGKSQLLNAILGQERAIVDEEAGTTRDALDTIFQYDGRRLVLIDTAGIRRRGRVETGVEKYSVLRAVQAISRADVALLVTEAVQPINAQDLHIAGYVHDACKGLLLIVNKWDLVSDRDPAPYLVDIQNRLRFMPYVPVLFTSALLGWGITDVLEQAWQVYEERQRTIPVEKLQEWLEQTIAKHPPPSHGGRRLRLLSLSQEQTNPPTFVFQMTPPQAPHFSYRRYLENQLRQAFGFTGTPLRLIFKGRK
ncbi:MAG: ribosome biogenesis GTPase Der [Chloroflexota bacterium]